MNAVKGFSTPTVKVSQMRQILESGGFANWISGLKKEQEERGKALEVKRRTMLRLENIIVGHARQPRKYHTWFIVFLLAVILFCVLVIALRSQVAPMRPAPMVIKIQPASAPAVPGISPAKKPEPQLTMQHIVAQMMVESHGNHGAVSAKGCVGSMQVMPATAAECGISEWELHHPVLGLDAGIRIMKGLWVRWRTIGDPGLRWAMTLASYNCGHWRAKQFYYGLLLRQAGIQARWFRFLPMETLVYIDRITMNYGGGK